MDSVLVFRCHSPVCKIGKGRKKENSSQQNFIYALEILSHPYALDVCYVYIAIYTLRHSSYDTKLWLMNHQLTFLQGYCQVKKELLKENVRLSWYCKKKYTLSFQA